MRHLGFDGEPSDEVLDRLSAPVRSVLIDTDKLRTYIRARLREEKLSLYRVSEATGWARPRLSKALKEGESVSLERLEMLLYIVDGGTDKWNEYLREHEGR